jgi:hypothetical protein
MADYTIECPPCSERSTVRRQQCHNSAKLLMQVTETGHAATGVGFVVAVEGIFIVAKFY